MRWMLLAATFAAVASTAGCETHPFRRGLYCAPPVYPQPTCAPAAYSAPTYTAPPQCTPACMPVVPACTCP